MKFFAEFHTHPPTGEERYTEAQKIEFLKREIGIKFGQKLFADVEFRTHYNERTGSKTHRHDFFIIDEAIAKRIHTQLELAEQADCDTAKMIIHEAIHLFRNELNRTLELKADSKFLEGYPESIK